MQSRKKARYPQGSRRRLRQLRLQEGRNGRSERGRDLVDRIAWVIVGIELILVLLFILGCMRYGGIEGLVYRVRTQISSYQSRPSVVPTSVPTPTPDLELTATRQGAASSSPEPLMTLAPIQTATPAPSATPTPPTTASPAPSAMVTPSSTATPASSATSTPSPTASPTPSATPTPAVIPGTVVRDMTRLHASLSIDEVDGFLDDFLPAHTHTQSQYGVDTYRIWFRTRDRDGQVIAIQADLYVPRMGVPTEFPIFVYGSGTTGIASSCAPLNEEFQRGLWGDYRSHMLSYATQGYIAVIPNWQGFDDPNHPHPYFVAELEGYVMLDVARAVYDFFAKPPAVDILARPAQAVFLSGYSQGGHGAFAGDAMANQYAPELNIVGIIGHATAPDVEGLMYDSPRYAPYIVYAYRDYYGQKTVDPRDVFLERWLSTYNRDVTKCIDDVIAYYSNTAEGMYTPRFRNALYSNQLATEFPAFKDKLDLNYSGREVNPSTPAIILHGAADPIVQLHTVDRFVTSMCQEGKSVTYRLYTGIDHFLIRQNSLVDTLAWMRDILDGVTPASDCARFAQ